MKACHILTKKIIPKYEASILLSYTFWKFLQCKSTFISFSAQPEYMRIRISVNLRRQLIEPRTFTLQSQDLLSLVSESSLLNYCNEISLFQYCDADAIVLPCIYYSFIKLLVSRRETRLFWVHLFIIHLIMRMYVLVISSMFKNYV